MAYFVVGGGAKIAKALGFDPKFTRDIHLHFPVGGLATAEVEHTLTAEQIEAIENALKEMPCKLENSATES